MADWVVIGVIAFVGGLVRNIIVPSRRGIFGYAGAALIGVFCGCTLGFSAHAAEWPRYAQWLLTGAVAFLGDQLLAALSRWKFHEAHTPKVHYGDVVSGTVINNQNAEIEKQQNAGQIENEHPAEDH